MSLLCRRPDRTRQWDEPRRRAPSGRSATQAIPISRTTLHGIQRSIAVLHRDGDEPAITIARWTMNGECIGRLTLHRRDLAPLVRAVALAREGRAGTAGDILHGDVALRIWTHADSRADRPIAILMGRVRVADGERIGSVSTYVGDELAALARAIDVIERL